MQETQVRSLGWEDPLEEGMVSLSSVLAWRTLWTEEPGGLQSLGSQKVGQDWATNTFHFQIQLAPILICLHLQRLFLNKIAVTDTKY